MLDIKIICKGDDDYPQNLYFIKDAPDIIFAMRKS